MEGKGFVSLKDGMVIEVFDDYIGNLIRNSNGYYEEEILFHFIDYIPVNGIIYDIGANIGNHTLFFSKYLKSKTIFSFEPSTENFSLLDKNVKRNNLKNVMLFNTAVGANKGKAEIHFNKDNTGASKVSETNKGEIDLIKIDDLSIPGPDFIKIDVEGFEIQVLKGMEKCIKNHKPTIWIEIHEENYEKVDALLSEAGYILLDRWLDNYIFFNLEKSTSNVELFERIKDKPLKRLNSKVSNLNLKYRSLSEKNINLATQLKTLKEEKTKIENDKLHLENKLYILNREIALNRELISDMKDNNKFEIIYKELQKEKEQYEKAFAGSYKIKLDYINQQIDEVKNDLNESKRKLAIQQELEFNSIKVELAEAKSESIKIINENTSLKETNSSLNAELLKMRETIKELKEEISYFNEKLAQSEKKHEESSKSNLNFELTIKEQEERIHNLDNDNKNLNTEINKMLSYISTLEENNHIKESEIESFILFEEKSKEKIENQQAQINSLTESNTTLTNDKNKLMLYIQNLEEKDKLKDIEIEELNTNLAAQQQKNEALHNQVENILNQKLILENKLNNNIKEINSLTNYKKVLIIENTNLKAELENELIDKINLISKEEMFTIKIKEHEVDTKKYKYENIKLNQKITSFEKQIDTLNKKYNSLRDSKLGKITIRYWSVRKKVKGGRVLGKFNIK